MADWLDRVRLFAGLVVATSRLRTPALDGLRRPFDVCLAVVAIGRGGTRMGDTGLLLDTIVRYCTERSFFLGVFVLAGRCRACREFDDCCTYGSTKTKRKKQCGAILRLLFNVQYNIVVSDKNRGRRGGGREGDDSRSEIERKQRRRLRVLGETFQSTINPLCACGFS